MLFCGEYQPAPAELAAQHLTETARAALADFAARARDTEWNRAAISALELLGKETVLARLQAL
ncbi:glutamyl-tRNA synthetase [Bordetella pertussis]|nr:glutamyl-tRNA synthetase [Bordetella pertussis]